MNVTRGIISQFAVHAVLLCILLLVAPRYPDTSFTLVSLFFYVFQILSWKQWIYIANVKNKLDFNIIFFIMLCFCTYLIPLFYVFGLGNSFFTTIVYNDKYINKALILNSIAVEFYFLGYIYGQQNALKTIHKIDTFFVKLFNVNRVNRFFSILTLFTTFILFIIIDKLSADSVDIKGPIVTAIVITIILPLLVAGYSNKYFHYGTRDFIIRNGVVIFCALLLVLRTFLLGDRLTPLSILLTLAFVYSRFVKPIGWKMLVTGIAIGAFLMVVISLTRESFKTSNSTSKMISSLSEGSQSVVSLDDKTVLFQDIIPINLDFYVGIEYVENKDYFNPMRIFLILISPVPYLPSYLKQMLFDGNTSTAFEITQKNKLKSRLAGDSGLGTHIVGDVYMSWGVLGIMVVFFVWGFIIGQSYVRADSSFLHCIIYGSMMSYAIYFPRATFDTNIRDVAYMIIVFFIVKQFYK